MIVLLTVIASLGLLQALPATPSAEARQESAAPGMPLSPADISQLRAKAEAGDQVAENALGVMYRTGRGVDPDKVEAVRWYRRAAKHGSAAAMFNLGAAYYNGDGIGVDDVTSCAWFLLSQEAGYPQADEAVRRAASENPSRITEASARVAEMYQLGEELPENATSALKWYRKAADGGAPAAAVRAASLLLANGRVPTPEEYTEARNRCEDAANRHYSQGAYCTAVIYRLGLGVPKDPAQTARWLTRAAELGHPKAVLQLGEAYWRGEGVKADRVTAYMWIWMAYRSKVSGAEQDEEALRREMSTKDIAHSRKKAEEWVKQRHFLVIRPTSANASSSVQ